MDEISFKGENYVKASVLARKYGYTSDYIGQLCRGEVVRATLVGRSWYVSEESLLAHRAGRYRSNLAKSKEMVRKLAEERAERSYKPTNVRRHVRYENDEGDLLPSLREKSMMDDGLDTGEANPVEEIEAEEREEYASDLEAREEESTSASEEISQNEEAEDDKDEAYESEEVSVPVRVRPTVRTIPAYSRQTYPKDMVLRQRELRPYREYDEYPVAPLATKRSRSLVPALVVTLLAGELILVSLALGLDKKVAIDDSGRESVVYDFNFSQVANAIGSINR